jgi:hypothetical protein
MEKGKEGTRKGLEAQIMHQSDSREPPTYNSSGNSNTSESGGGKENRNTNFEWKESYQRRGTFEVNEMGPSSGSYGREQFPVRGEPLHVKEEPIRYERMERPALIRKEHIHPVETEEIQPIIHRQREFREIREVEVPVQERTVKETGIIERELPPEHRPEVVIASSAPSTRRDMKPQVEYDQPERRKIVKPAIIEETIYRTVREEVQPMIEREVVEPRIIKETLPIYEKIIEPVNYKKEERKFQEGKGKDSYQVKQQEDFYHQKPEQQVPLDRPYIVEHSVWVKKA